MSTDVIAADARYRKAINLAANAQQIEVGGRNPVARHLI